MHAAASSTSARPGRFAGRLVALADAAPAWAVLAAAGLGLVAMALVAAIPGSPYQPIQLREPAGVLPTLAVGLGLDRVGGNASLAIGVLVAGSAVAGFLWLLRASAAGRVGVGAVALFVAAAHLLLLLGVPLVFSRDAYSYAYYGRIEARYGANPYLQTPLDHADDPLWRVVGPKWVDTPAVYGPAWTAASAWLAERFPSPADHVAVYPTIAIVASLATCAAIAAAARRLRPDAVGVALAAFGANPVVLFHTVAGGHNDVVVALGIALGLWFVASGRVVLALLVLTLGALVKATGALPLLLLVGWSVGDRPPSERRRALLVELGLVAGVALVFAAPYLSWRDPTLGMLELATHEGWLAPAAVLGRVLNVVSLGTLGWVVRLGFGVVLVVAVGWTAAEVYRRRAAGLGCSAAELGAAWGWLLVSLALLGPVLLPWYVAWALPLAWLMPERPRRALLAASCLLAVTLWSAEPLRFPGGFDLNLVVGEWIVTPALLVLALRALVDLRRRLALGLPLGPGRTAERAAPEPAQRVPAPGGEGRGDEGAGP
ncbi:MAG: hypothetical protein KatS3mg013_1900 [Actinomycetota bacterium]|nr:MAG: hypothetical protein KatS3mg013_1900 [Actinomycetota bacterium]